MTSDEAIGPFIILLHEQIVFHDRPEGFQLSLRKERWPRRGTVDRRWRYLSDSVLTSQDKADWDFQHSVETVLKICNSFREQSVICQMKLGRERSECEGQGKASVGERKRREQKKPINAE
jgi:hypothetical protein